MCHLRIMALIWNGSTMMHWIQGGVKLILSRRKVQQQDSDRTPSTVMHDDETKKLEHTTHMDGFTICT